MRDNPNIKKWKIQTIKNKHKTLIPNTPEVTWLWSNTRAFWIFYGACERSCQGFVFLIEGPQRTGSPGDGDALFPQENVVLGRAWFNDPGVNSLGQQNTQFYELLSSVNDFHFSTSENVHLLQNTILFRFLQSTFPVGLCPLIFNPGLCITCDRTTLRL